MNVGDSRGQVIRRTIPLFNALIRTLENILETLPVTVSGRDTRLPAPEIKLMSSEHRAIPTMADPGRTALRACGSYTSIHGIASLLQDHT